MLNKKTVYIALAVFLGILTVNLLFIAAELYLRESLAEGRYLQEFSLPASPVFFLACEAAGAIAGYHIGKAWWRIIYIEDRREKSYKPDW